MEMQRIMALKWLNGLLREVLGLGGSHPSLLRGPRSLKTVADTTNRFGNS